MRRKQIKAKIKRFWEEALSNHVWIGPNVYPARFDMILYVFRMKIDTIRENGDRLYWASDPTDYWYVFNGIHENSIRVIPYETLHSIKYAIITRKQLWFAHVDAPNAI